MDFQNFSEFMDEKRCRDQLLRELHTGDPRCPHCDAEFRTLDPERFFDGGRCYCHQCGKKFDARTGTYLQATKLSYGQISLTMLLFGMGLGNPQIAEIVGCRPEGIRRLRAKLAAAGLAPEVQVVRKKPKIKELPEGRLKKFLSECCMLADFCQANSTELYRLFVAWWKKTKPDQPPPSQKRFGALMRRRFKYEKHGTYFYFGVQPLDDSGRLDDLSGNIQRTNQKIRQRENM